MTAIACKPTLTASRASTRGEAKWAARMPTISAALKALPVNNLVLDGELVAIDRAGKPSFYELPNELKVRVKARLVYYAFDLLFLDGFDLRRAPLVGSVCSPSCCPGSG
jgi:bifunctional non-homologous end joining protein LigD